MAERIRITEVAPRDGLQNEPRPIPTSDKLRLVEALALTGVDEIEVTSFVSPAWIPQLGDASELLALIKSQARAWPLLSALVPNEKGLDAALRANDSAGFALIGKVAVFTAASETFAKRNINASIAQSLDRFKPVITRARSAGLRVRGYVSCAIRCPFEGAISPRTAVQVGQALLDLGCDELDFADTIGQAEAPDINALLNTFTELVGDRFLPNLTLHLHDTFGRAAECIIEALGLGVRSFDASVAGLGGCPYASTPGRPAPGNISTEVLVRTVEDAGFATSVSAAHLERARTVALELISRARNGATA